MTHDSYGCLEVITECLEVITECLEVFRGDNRVCRGVDIPLIEQF